MPNLTAAQVAQRLDVDPRTVRRWCESGVLKASRFGRAWVIDSDALTKFVRPTRGRPFKKA